MRPEDWGIHLDPATLDDMPQEFHEMILDKLPQCGAIKHRTPGELRVLSMGFNVHIGGNDPRVPYPVDFCVRASGERAGVNLLIRPKPLWFRPEMLEGTETGPGANFFSVAKHINEVTGGVYRHLRNWELLLLKTYRPASPSGYQWGTAGGVFEVTDTEESVSIRETKEEFRGFKYLGWSPLLSQQLYQSGNIFELQSIGVVIGFMDASVPVKTAHEEGIEDWLAVELDKAEAFQLGIEKHSWKDGDIWTDGKVSHGLSILLPRMERTLSREYP